MCHYYVSKYPAMHKNYFFQTVFEQNVISYTKGKNKSDRCVLLLSVFCTPRPSTTTWKTLTWKTTILRKYQYEIPDLNFNANTKLIRDY